MRVFFGIFVGCAITFCSAQAADFVVRKDSRIEVVCITSPDCVYCRSWRHTMAGDWSRFSQTDSGKTVLLVTVDKGNLRNRMKREYYGAQHAFLFDRAPAFGDVIPAWWLLVDGQPVTRRVGENAWKGDLEPVIEKFARAKISGGGTVSYAPKQPNLVAVPASIDDVDNLPYLSGPGKESYRRFLRQEAPRAFAVSPDGSYGWRSGGSDPGSIALHSCNARAVDFPCKLYAVDNKVVYKAE